LYEELLDELVGAIDAHYAVPNAPPLLLSKFGQTHPDLAFALKSAFGGVRQAIIKAGENRLRIVDDTPGRQSVATAEKAPAIEIAILKQSANQRVGSSNFDSLPSSVQIAFCVKVQAGEIVALRVTPPWDYMKVKSLELVRPGFIHVQEKFRKPGLALKNASQNDKDVLWQMFIAWSEENGIDPNSFKGGTNTNALVRLLSAQSPDIMARLVIPADIAALLLRHS
jgi:hypothetical protein